MGGIIGYSTKGEIKNCINRGNINGYSYVGGIVGRKNYSTIEECKNYGNITASYSLCGGITGVNYGGLITKCFNEGKICIPSGGYYGAAGIAGSILSEGKIELCYNFGEIYSLANTTNGRQTGGIVANVDTNAVIENCYNLGYVHGIGALGGIIGWGRDPTVRNCYNAGKIEFEEGNNVTKGGIIGSLATDSENYILENNYWLDTCGANNGIDSLKSNEGAEKKTDAQLKNLASVLGEAYETDIRNENKGYPYLKENEVK